MRKLLNNPWVVLGLCSVAVVILYFSADEIEVQPLSAPSARAPRPLLVPKVDLASVEHVTIDLAKLDWPTTIIRDPFAPATQSHGGVLPLDRNDGLPILDMVQPPPLQLRAVAMKPAPKVAMINRQIVSEGDEIEGLRVTRIESDGVWLKGPAGSHHIGFEKGTVQSRTVERKEDVPTSRPQQKREVERPKEDATLLDGRDCSRSSVCS